MITNEIGQWDQGPKAVTNMLTVVVKEQLPIAVWFDGDGNHHAIGLHNTNATIRPNGTAFAAFTRR